MKNFFPQNVEISQKVKYKLKQNFASLSYVIPSLTNLLKFASVLQLMFYYINLQLYNIHYIYSFTVFKCNILKTLKYHFISFLCC